MGFFLFVFAVANTPAEALAAGDASTRVEELTARMERAQKENRTEEMAACGTQLRESARGQESLTLDVLEAFQSVARSYENQGAEEAAVQWHRHVLDEAERRDIEHGTPSASIAAESAFMVAEYEFEAWQAIEFPDELAAQKRQLENLLDVAKRVRSAYNRVYTYKEIDWTVAANHRTAQLYEEFAEKMMRIDSPFEEGSEKDAIYRGQLAEYARPFEDQAIARYKKNLAYAEQSDDGAEWVTRSRRALHKWFPNEY